MDPARDNPKRHHNSTQTRSDSHIPDRGEGESITWLLQSIHKDLVKTLERDPRGTQDSDSESESEYTPTSGERTCQCGAGRSSRERELCFSLLPQAEEKLS